MSPRADLIEAADPAEKRRSPRWRQYPKYKDSGIEWLGQVPAHWDAKRLKFAARLESGHTPSRQVPEYWVNCTIPWVSLSDVGKLRAGTLDVIDDTEEKISELGLANSAARLLPKDTVILSRTASVGFAAILGKPMATTQDFVNWICGPRIRSRYLLQCFRAMHQEFEQLTMGSTHQTIYMPDVNRFAVPLPPIEEQVKIDAFIRRETAKIDGLASKRYEATVLQDTSLVGQLVRTLFEYRDALIFAAVTGRIDVRAETG